MTEHRPIFRSVSQALHVSYLMAVLPPSQKGSMQSALEALMRQAGIRTDDMGDGSLNFEGLSPLEVRAQCAMVVGAVNHHCADMERAAICAWFAHDSTKADGVHALRDYCGEQFSVQARAARTLIVWSVHATGNAAELCTERAIAAEHDIPKTTLHRNIVMVRRVASRLRRAGMDRLEPMFEAGTCPLIDSERILVVHA